MVASIPFERRPRQASPALLRRNAAWIAVARRLALPIEHGLLDRRVQPLRGEDFPRFDKTDCVLDCHQDALLHEKVICVGWSGGGSLSLFYQADAEAPLITATPAGDAVDLTQAGLEPADGVIFIAAHLSRAETLIARWLLETMKPVSGGIS